MPGADRPRRSSPGGNRPGAVTATALAVAAAEVGVVVAVLSRGPAGRADHGIVAVVACALCFGLVGMAPMRIELSEHRVEWLLSEAVLVVALVHLATPWVVAAALGGQVLCEAVQRKPPLKTAVNLATAGAAAATACVAFSVRPAGNGPGTWAAALLAVAASCTTDALAVTTVVARAEGGRTARLLVQSWPISLVTSGLAGTVGLVVVLLLRAHPLAPLTLVPLAACSWANARTTSRQRDEHQRVQRLYEATDRTSALVDAPSALPVLADEARRLLTGTVALCAVRDGDGWTGASAGVAAGVPLDVAGVLLAAARRALPAAVPLPDQLVPLAGGADTLLVARSPEGSGVDLVVGVARSGAPGAGLGATLHAFASHGAVVVATTRALEELRASLDAQVQANRRKDEFVATISHELRTPLTVMLGSAQTVLRAGDRLDGATRHGLLDAAVRQGQRLQALIEDLLLVAAGSSGRQACTAVPLGVAGLLVDVVDDVPDDLRAGVDVVDATGGAGVLADRARVRQVLANLVGNAGKYAGGSRITVEARAAGDRVTIAVVDHGPGIAAGDRDRAFERFVQLDQSSTRTHSGTGLGLHLSRELATQMSGTLTLVETPGGGCTFELGLPRCDPPPTDEVPAAADDDDFGLARPALSGGATPAWSGSAPRS
ncbi:MAG TPA: HAMP domain-containing sensor histidine kinase [Acidimicrobiales bacterium]|nr:HAMP domain-containing sensor histidine kinase [Acidimicrobiales bacterium]